ncbi:zinc finger protein ZAT9-like [Corylus avellana]|uniref:zinc finger protein ZAT9-like n=1 Tax=Corylus avellana TaxID=13451 RepID=UPI00286C9352|nr:zinc finger protein ZAT9-like [Corylus avellana]
MEKHRICKICNRRFANGKAMGGHMRSHLAKHPIPPKPPQQHDNSPLAAAESTQPSPSSSSSLVLHSIKNPMQSYRSLNGELANSDRESENESHPQNPTRRRSKRQRKTAVPVPEPEPEPVSSVSDAFPEEDVAMCLLMLSRDKWSKGKEKVRLEDDEEDEDHDYPLCQIRTQTQPQAKFRCETCRKVFRSYQALGGHRASHKKTKLNEEHVEDLFQKKKHVEDQGNKVVVEDRVFECPFCLRVFESGQALGGHKKVHFSNFGDIARSTARSLGGDNLIDLNLPAPEEEDEVSQQVAFSTVSNAA